MALAPRGLGSAEDGGPAPSALETRPTTERASELVKTQRRTRDSRRKEAGAEDTE